MNITYNNSLLTDTWKTIYVEYLVTLTFFLILTIEFLDNGL